MRSCGSWPVNWATLQVGAANGNNKGNPAFSYEYFHDDSALKLVTFSSNAVIRINYDFPEPLLMLGCCIALIILTTQHCVLDIIKYLLHRLLY